MRTNRLARSLAAVAVVASLTVAGADAAPASPTASRPAPPSGPSTLPPTSEQEVETPSVDDLVTQIPTDERAATFGDRLGHVDRSGLDGVR